MQNVDESAASVYGLSELSADELLLACGYEGLYTFSLHTGESVVRVRIALRGDVRSVAFDAHTNTLLLVVKAADNWQLVSLRRNESEWLEVQRSTSIIEYSYFPFRCATRVCCSETETATGCMCST